VLGGGVLVAAGGGGGLERLPGVGRVERRRPRHPARLRPPRGNGGLRGLHFRPDFFPFGIGGGEGRAEGGGDEHGAVFLLDEMAKGSGFFFLKQGSGLLEGKESGSAAVAAQRPGVARWPGLRNLLCFADPNGWALQVFSDINIDLV